MDKVILSLLLLTSVTAFGQVDFNVFAKGFKYSLEQKQDLVDVLGDFPTETPLNIDTLEIVELADVGHRLLLRYLSEPKDTVFGTPVDLIQAYLFVPRDVSIKYPAIVAIHQDGPNDHIGKKESAGVAGDSSLFYGLELFNKGYVVICPDRYQHSYRRRIPNPGQKQSDEDLVESAQSHWVGQLLMQGRTHNGKEAYDLTRAVDVLYQYNFVDTSRIGAIGHSGGGHNLVPFVFADDRIKAAVSSCGFFETTYWFHENAAKKRGSQGALPGLLDIGIMTDYLAYIAPRPIMLTRGLHEWGDQGKWKQFSELDVIEYQHIEKYVGAEYARLGEEENFKILYFGEDGGRHALPPGVKTEVFNWLDFHLKD